MRSFGNSLGGFNSFLNELAYKPKGSKQSYLFYLPWLNHDFNAAFNLQDAGGPILRGLVVISCTGADLGYGWRSTDREGKPFLQTLLELDRHSAHRTKSRSRSNRRTARRHLRIRSRSEMSKRAPSTTQLLVITGFALSCFGILLFLWVTFGGPTPFRAKTYEVKVPFNEATQLAEQSDVRISGVNVGKVQKIELAPNGKQALATAAIDDQYAPLPESTRAILRTKTLLGETYIELTPGSREGPGARRRRHPARGQRRRIGPARRDLPHLQRPDPRRLPGMDAGSGGGDQRPGPEPLLRARQPRTRPSPNSTSSSASSTASSWRSASCSATAPPPSRPCAAAKASWPT